MFFLCQSLPFSFQAAKSLISDFKSETQRQVSERCLKMYSGIFSLTQLQHLNHLMGYQRPYYHVIELLQLRVFQERK